jgi:hypothetical protein
MVTPVASRRLLYVEYDDNQNKQKKGEMRCRVLDRTNDVAYFKISLSANDECNGERERPSRKFCVLGVNLGAVSALRGKPSQNLCSGR